MATTAVRGATGEVVQVQGAVVDVEFPPDHLPEIYNAIEVEMPGGATLTLEAQQHLGNDWVRCVAMSSTDGLRRGSKAVDIGSSIRVPVGTATLGRIFNVVGDPVDGNPDVDRSLTNSIHRQAPDCVDQATSV